MVPRTDEVTRTSPVGVEEGMHNIMAVLEEHVMPMLLHDVVTVASETNEANRSSLVEGLFRQAQEKMKKLQFCFGSKLYPGAVSMSPKFPAIECMMHPKNPYPLGITVQVVHLNDLTKKIAEMKYKMQMGVAAGHIAPWVELALAFPLMRPRLDVVIVFDSQILHSLYHLETQAS